MKKIAFTGLNGVLGKYMITTNQTKVSNHTIIDLYHSKPSLHENISHQKLDLSQLESIIPTLEKHKPDIVVHLAAITHIDRCELDKSNGKSGKVWHINVDSTKKIVEFCKQHNKKLLYFSTECVFDGTKEFYTEKDIQSPINWYGTTKAEAEKYILENCDNSAIIRGVVSYHQNDEKGETIFGLFKKYLESSTPIQAVHDQSFTPTYIEDFAITIEKIIELDARGIFHATPYSATSPYKFGQQIAEFLDYNKKLISKSTLEKYFGLEKSTLRLRHASLDSTETQKKLGILYKSLEQVLSAYNK